MIENKICCPWLNWRLFQLYIVCYIFIFFFIQMRDGVKHDQKIPILFKQIASLIKSIRSLRKIEHNQSM